VAVVVSGIVSYSPEAAIVLIDLRGPNVLAVVKAGGSTSQPVNPGRTLVVGDVVRETASGAMVVVLSLQ
jgi:hypothetical protein